MNEIQKLIEIYENLDGLNSQSIRLKLKEVIEELKNYQSKENKWIPVSERLPDKNDNYLVTVEMKNIDYKFVAKWHFNKCEKPFWTEAEPTREKVIAWMPLPEPYKENEGD